MTHNANIHDDRYFNNSAVGIVETDADQKIVRVNDFACWMLGYSSEELLHRSWMEVTHAEEIGKTKDHFRQVLEEGRIAQVMTVRCWTKCGETRSLAVNVQAGEPGADARPAYYIAFLMDVSCQKKAEQEVLIGIQRLVGLQGKIGKALDDALGSRDPYTAGHQYQVEGLAGRICDIFGLPDLDRRTVCAAASVHDIGKIAIPAEYLSKPTKLEDLELMTIRSHAKRGFEILHPLQMEFPVAEIVYQHHERLDGSGYPRGLRNGGILREAQIVAVADLADSILNARPYRHALGKQHAIDVLLTERGSKLDASIVDAGIHMLNSLPVAP